MSKIAIIENGIVTNIARGNELLIPWDDATQSGWVNHVPGVEIGWLYDGGQFEAPVEPLADRKAAMQDSILAKRADLLAGGFDYEFGDARGQHRIGMTPNDMIGWDEVSKGAAAAILAGQPDLAIAIVSDTGPVDVTALEWQSILLAAMAFRQPIWATSFSLQAQVEAAADHGALDAIDIDGWQ